MTAKVHNLAFNLLSDFDREESAFDKPDPEVQLKTAFDDGYQQGLADGRAEAQADAELRLADAETMFSERLNEERQAFQRDCADVLLMRFDGAMRSISRAIEERVAELLRPWLKEQLRIRAVQELEQAISRALVDGAKVHIEAPADVLNFLRDRLPVDAFHIGLSESPSADIRAHIEDTQIEANIAAWISELEALAT
ncbi:hypothetical protein [Hyphomicrobium sp.]|jgi:hypothetical protein|uniref:hypothetical protein n=1 Tax=Hyphomicrobium sp. TaxID=82 RepID=UPI002CB79EB6|nr:hypothetical protein [Hyphomicrobium sp.]HVZ04389.1 hypothetical protein [Hyphomicrobium sp.]